MICGVLLHVHDVEESLETRCLKFVDRLISSSTFADLF